MNKLISLCICLATCLSAALNAGAADTRTLSAWLPYWEAESAEAEAEELSDSLDTAVAFAAIFDNGDKPLMLPETKALLERLQTQYSDSDTRVLLSIVNDVELSEGKYENKSTELLRRLFKDEESILRHIESLFSLVDDYGLSGLEIDYEAMKNDRTLWKGFAAFIKELYRQFSAQGLTLRVVLSWDATKHMELPEGPEYSVMCYNLYGSHSGPGPKADIAFLKTTCELYEDYADSTHMAFATGGFDWSPAGTTAMTQQQAAARLEECGVRPTRDLASGALYAVYRYEGVSHTLWYADAATLATWRSTVAKRGFESIDLFRLGGNDLEDWEKRLLT